MHYTEKAAALVRAKERAANAGTEADAFLNEFLDLSAAKDAAGTTHYRPFLAAAVWLEQSPQFQQLSEADGVVFTQMKEAIASLRALQLGYDSAQELKIPAGLEAIASGRSLIPFPSTTIKTRAVI